MALGDYLQAARTAIIIARQEQLLGTKYTYLHSHIFRSLPCRSQHSL